MSPSILAGIKGLAMRGLANPWMQAEIRGNLAE